MSLVTVFTSRCWVVASNGRRSPSSGFPNCPRPQLPQLSADSMVMSAGSCYVAPVQTAKRSWDSVVCIVTGCGLDDRGVEVRVLVGSSRPALGSIQPPIQWIPGALSPGVKRPGRKAGHSPPASAEVKKMWIYTSAHPYTFMA
jgi:hypothetical protein